MTREDRRTLRTRGCFTKKVGFHRKEADALLFDEIRKLISREVALVKFVEFLAAKEESLEIN